MVPLGWPMVDWQQAGSERVWAAAMVLLLHAAAIALVLLSPAIASVAPKPGLTTFAIAIDGAAKPRTHPTRPRHPRAVAQAMPKTALQPQTVQADVAPPVPDVADPSPVVLQQVTAMQGSGACDLTQPVQDALRHNDKVRDTMAAIPADQRSVANAIVVWNAGWIEHQSAAANAAYATLRQAISQLVADSSADCRNQVQTGPRFMYLPDSAGKTTVLALGSGRWTWQQLIDGAKPLSAGAMDETPPPLVFAPPAAIAPVTIATAQGAPGSSAALNALLASLIRKQPPADQRN